VNTASPADGNPGTQTAACLHNASPEVVADHLEREHFFWLDLEDPPEEKLDKIAEKVGLHPLTVDDARTFDQRPKLDEYDGYIFLVAYGVDPDTASGEPLLLEVHVIVSGDFVITIHRRPIAALNDLRERFPKHPKRSEQFLVYKILDAVTTTFFPVLTRIDDAIDEIEQDVIAEPTQAILQRIFSLKRDLVAMRRVVSPERDLFARDGERIADLRGLEADDRLYFRDLYDSLVRIDELVDSYRDLLSGATDMYLSTVANRQGEVNKTLTMIATVFLPLTFLTGFFGQNFSFLTNHVLNTEWSFIVFGVGLLLVSTLVFIIYFRRKRWM
jgi:magnesium transporter